MPEMQEMYTKQEEESRSPWTSLQMWSTFLHRSTFHTKYLPPQGYSSPTLVVSLSIGSQPLNSGIIFTPRPQAPDQNWP